ncbi:hypothetical protein J4401_05795 [Candidatus Woesearchaeota archaeon]|nr:hypothetical protein [Candidatus Woesearchaeota archaeon]
MSEEEDDQIFKCTLKRRVVLSSSCISKTPLSCAEEEGSCSPPKAIAHSCIDKNGVKTTQMCCPVFLFESGDSIDPGQFSQPGGMCPPPTCSKYPGDGCNYDYDEPVPTNLIPNKPYTCKDVKEDGTEQIKSQACCSLQVNGKAFSFISEASCPTQCPDKLGNGCFVKKSGSGLDCQYEQLPFLATCMQPDGKPGRCSEDGHCINA